MEQADQRRASETGGLLKAPCHVTVLTDCILTDAAILVILMLKVFTGLQPTAIWKPSWKKTKCYDKTAVQNNGYFFSSLPYGNATVSSFEVMEQNIQPILSFLVKSLLLKMKPEKQPLPLSTKSAVFKLLRDLPFQGLQQDGICAIKKQHTELQ